MTVNYLYTFEDYEEATRVAAARIPKKAKTGWQEAATMLPGVLLLLGIGFWQWITGSTDLAVVFHLVAPIFLWLGTIYFARWVMSFSQGKKIKLSWSDVRGMVAVLAPAILVVGFIFLNSVGRPGRLESWNWLLLLPHTTWVGLVFWYTVKNIRAGRKRLRESWDEQPTAHRAKTAEITAEGVTIFDSVGRWEQRWEGFVDYQETTSLFLLFLNRASKAYIPKRAFANEEELNAMRALMELIPRPVTIGFPMDPFRVGKEPPPPLPEISR